MFTIKYYYKLQNNNDKLNIIYNNNKTFNKFENTH